MKKRLIGLLMLSLIVLLNTGCAAEHVDIDPHQIDEVAHKEDNAQSSVAECLDETGLIPANEPSQEQAPVQKATLDLNDAPRKLQSTTSHPPTAPSQASVSNPTSSQTPAATPKPTQASTSEAPKGPNLTPKPVASAAPQPASATEPTSQPTLPPAVTPQPTPVPTAPPVIVVTPPQARTICNTCSADITDNVAEHGTMHLLAGENFSYRNE